MTPPKYFSLSQGRLRRTAAYAVTILLLCNGALGATQAKTGRKAAPKVAAVRATEIKVEAGGRVSFKLTIKGDGYGQSAEAVKLSLLDTDGEDALGEEDVTFESVTPTKIVAQIITKPGPYSLRLNIGRAVADTSQIGPLAVPAGETDEDVNDTRAVAARPPAGLALEDPEVFAYPSDGGLKKYALVVKRKQGEGEFFATDSKLVSLVLTPAGASDVVIRRVTPTRIEADFWAHDKYQIKDVGVTVYDRNNPQVIAASSDIEVPSADDANAPAEGARKSGTGSYNALAGKETGEGEQPKITSTAVVFLQRAYGIGRLKIEGKGFGDYKAPPVSAEDYLLCFEPLARQALYRALEESRHPDIEGQQRYEDQRCIAPDGSKKASAGKSLTATGQQMSPLDQWREWRARVEKLVKVSLVPKNTDLRIEQTKILYADDTLIDVYFEFNRYFHNSQPLRLASATVTVKKPVKPIAEEPRQTPKKQGNGEVASANGASVVNAALGANSEEKKDMGVAAKGVTCETGPCKTYIVSSKIGEAPGLEYTYNVLDNASAEMLFGKGVAGNFYAILLSVTNNGDRKISVPLSSIRAEIEWAYGPDDAKGKRDVKSKGNDPIAAQANRRPPGSKAAKAFVTPTELGDDTPVDIPSTSPLMTFYYEEGPVTLAPLSLQTVTAFFDGDQKVNGVKAKLFNYFDGAAIFGQALTPFLGSGFRSGLGAFTGGAVPGLKRGLGDLSGQQLQNLTGMSWQDIEVVGAKGGSVVKYIFIQRGDSSFSPGFNELVRKTIKNIQGMEVKGIEVVEGETKTATHTGQQ